MLAVGPVALTALLSTMITVVPAKPGPLDARTYTVPLTGEAEVERLHQAGLSGDVDGSGTVRLTFDPADRRICYGFSLSKLATPLMAHIHKGPASGSGPSVVMLFTGPGGDLNGCLKWIEKWVTEIARHPSEFYVNLYTTEYPEGALRGQLS